MFKVHPFGRKIFVYLLSSLVLSILLAACTEETLPETPMRVTSTASLADAPPSPIPSIVPVVPVENTLIPSSTPFTLAEQPSSISYALPLVVQHIGKDSAVFYFELESPSEGVLYIHSVDEPNGNRLYAFGTETIQHQIMVDGLESGRMYQAVVGLTDGSGYRIPLYQGEAWQGIEFQTPVSGETLRVGVIGDSGYGDQVTVGLAEQMAGYDLDLVLHTGDTVYNIGDHSNPYEAFKQKWYEPFASLLQQMPIYPVVGNHDVERATYWDEQPFYYQAFPFFSDPQITPSPYEGRNQWYAFTYDDIQFVMLDTQVFFNEQGRAEQDAWLAERLADEHFRLTIPVFHVAFYTSGLHPNDGIAPRQSWETLFSVSAVPIVISGHDHNYERLIVNDLTYIVSGGGSAVLYGSEEILPQSLTFSRRSHFVLLVISETQITLQVVALGGEVIDEAVIPLP